MAASSFASSADLGEKEQTLEVLADGVYALTAEGDPNLGAIEGEDFLVCFEALATPVAAESGWRNCASTPTSQSDTWCSPITTRCVFSARQRSMPR